MPSPAGNAHVRTHVVPPAFDIVHRPPDTAPYSPSPRPSPVRLGRGLDDGAVAVAAGLDVFGVDTRGATAGDPSFARQLAAVVVDVLEVEGVDVAREVTQQRETDVDDKVCAQSAGLAVCAPRYERRIKLG